MSTSLTSQEKLFLQHCALQLRIDSIRATSKSGSGHPTSCLSAADIVAALFFHHMHYLPSNPHFPNNDRLIMSKGHAIPVIYAAWKQVGAISDEKLLSLREFDSPLEGHPTPRFPYNEAATGSLGQGLSIGLGMALSAQMRDLSYTTYVLMGDGEIAEGSIWEATELAAHKKVPNLVGIVDVNRLGQSEPTLDEHNLKHIAGKFSAFGWKTYTINGHDLNEIIATLDAATRDKQPVAIIAQTEKGYGIENVENQNGFHGKPFKGKDEKDAIESLRIRFANAAEYTPTHPFKPTPPKEVNLPSPKQPALDLSTDPNASLFAGDASMATRKAFGYGLAALGRSSSQIAALDGDVKNSTYTQIFETEHPDRFIQCYIAEQNMVGVATGLELRGWIPFAATFAAFLSRAHDQIRMAGIGRNALRLCGSHAGVSIGEDGPSQMGLEDISLMRAIPDSIVLYPSDGVTAYKLCEVMAQYDDGISYMRTTRMDTPMLYDHDAPVCIGGSFVHPASETPQACIVAAGVTLHEALKAQQALAEQSIHVTVIDAYSIKPLDTETIVSQAQNAGNLVLTVEDHYKEGGLYETVCGELINTDITVHGLYVDHVSRSGKPAQLLADAGIDADHITGAIVSLIS